MDRENSKRGLVPCSLFFVFLGYAVLSWMCEEIFGKNIWMSIGGCWYSSLTTAKAAYEVIKLIGLCSFIVGWIYNKWDKLSYGLPYGAYIKKQYKHYTCMSVFQIIATLFSIAAASAELCECAWASLIAVLSGLYYQWRVLQHIVLNEQTRKAWAPALWVEAMNRAASDKPEEKKWDTIFSLATQFANANEQDKDTLLKCLAKCTEDIQPELAQMMILWEKALGSMPDHDIVRYAEAFFKMLPQDCSRTPGAAFAAFLLENQKAEKIEKKDPLLHSLDLIRRFDDAMKPTHSALTNELYYLYFAVRWALFFYGKIKYPPSANYTTQPTCPSDKEMDIIRSTVRIILQNYGETADETMEDRISLALNLTKHALYASATEPQEMQSSDCAREEIPV